MIDFDRKPLLRAFRDESEELLSDLERLALDLDARPGHRSPVEEMFRCAHTLKGAASCLGFEQLVRVAHELEALFEAVTEHQRVPDRALAALALASVDVLRRGARVAEQAADDPIAGADELLARIAAWLAAPAAASLETARWDATEETGPATGRSLRVDVERLDSLLNLVGEVAVAQGRLGVAIEQYQKPAALSALQTFQGLFQTLQEGVMRLRLVPLLPTLERFRRATHELSQRVQKQVELVVDGGDVEVDMTLADALRDPLMHMLRNAIDHGIESPSRRRELGKPALGRVSMSARYDGNYVVVKVADDGSGLDLERLAAKASQRGFVVPAADEQALYELLYVPGVSTADEVTSLSGRGIGMDVVRRSIEGLRGNLTLESVPGRGLTISIRIPLSLALIQGFGVQVGQETYIVPVDSIRECIDLEHDRTLYSELGGVIDLRGKPLPFVDLAQQLGSRRSRGARRAIVVLEHGGRRAGLDVDCLLGEVQTMIKPLGPLFTSIKNVAGSAVMHDGRVALVLDVGSLLRTVAA